MAKDFLFTSESANEGHPDKICDQVADALLDCLIAEDPDSRVAVECMVTTGSVPVAGEVTTTGFACDETPELMPMPIMTAHRLCMRMPEVRRQRQEMIEKVIKPVCGGMYDDDTRTFINASGSFTLEGPEADTGVTGRKLIADTYGGMARNGDGAISGKDPSKVDRSGAYAPRWIAKNIVAAGLAKRCELQLSYVIGEPSPTSIFFDTQGTGVRDEHAIEALVRAIFPLSPREIIAALDLTRPIYRAAAAFGHFGRQNPDFTWERTDKAEALKKKAGL